MRVCPTAGKPYIILWFETSIRPHQMPGLIAQQTAQQAPQEAIKLTDEERQRVNRRASMELLQLISAQALAGLLVAAVAMMVSGVQAGLSALAGALRLLIAMQRPGGSGPGLFLVGKMLKMLAAVALLWLLAKYGGESVHWLAVFFGLLAVLKSYLLVFAYRALRGR